MLVRESIIQEADDIQENKRAEEVKAEASLEHVLAITAAPPLIFIYFTLFYILKVVRIKI